MKNSKITIGLCVGILLFLIGLILLQTIGYTWSNQTLYTSCEPKTINYESNDPYCLYIIKQTQTLDSKYIILVSMSAEKTYGHVINYPEQVIVSEDYLQKTKTEWDSTGITLTCYTGHKIFIPKEYFIKGR